MTDQSKTRRDVLTEDQPTSGMHPTETSKPIQEREEEKKPESQQESQEGGRQILNE